MNQNLDAEVAAALAELDRVEALRAQLAAQAGEVTSSLGMPPESRLNNGII